MKKRFLSMLLVLCMVVTLFPSAVSAEETGSFTQNTLLCENHREHDKSCGYVGTAKETPCRHLQEDGSYRCNPVKDSGTPDNNDLCDHNDGCGYAKPIDGKPCTHQCELCEQPENNCNCTVTCSPANAENQVEATINTDCPMCGANGADLTQCKGAIIMAAALSGTINIRKTELLPAGSR